MKLIAISFLTILNFSASASWGAGTVCATAGEESSTVLSCAAGEKISSISFASYGNPTAASCGSYKLGSCNASPALSAVKASCVGKGSCVIKASNSIYGDPCRGTVKKVAVQAVCVALAPSYATCASEGGVCTYSGGSTTIRYGAGSTFVSKKLPSGTACTNAVFGDPLVGTMKHCEVMFGTTVAAATPVRAPASTPTPAPAATPTPAPAAVSGVPTSDPQLGSCAGYRQVSPIIIHGQSNVVIDGVCVLNASENCVDIQDSTNVTIRNSKFGSCKGSVIYANNSKKVVIENNILYNPRSDNPAAVKVQYVQFNHVTGGGNRIRFNRGYGIAGQNELEDSISLHATYGIAGDPVMIYGNKIDGFYPGVSGGGIMMGDDGGGYQCAVNNIAINPGQYGIAFTATTNSVMKQNKVFGKQHSVSNVGVYAWRDPGSLAGTSCNADVIKDNRVNWTNSSGSDNGSWLDTGTCLNLVNSGNNFADKTLTEASLRAEVIPYYDEAAMLNLCKP